MASEETNKERKQPDGNSRQIDKTDRQIKREAARRKQIKTDRHTDTETKTKSREADMDRETKTET